MEGDTLLILGASARSAAFSARRAGLTPVCADLFADWDLAQWCRVARVPGGEYPDGLEAAARHAPPGPWAYVGALENYPDLVGRIAASRPLWGNGAEVLRQVRDPFQVAACLDRAGLPHPAVRRTSEGLARDGSWLIKPLAGAGGRDVRLWTDSDLQYSVLSTQYYFQQHIDGLPCAAVFVADGRRALLVGVTQQLVGEPAFHAKPFHYCGSIGPLALPDGTLANVRALGDALAAEFRLIGLFGVDGLLREQALWPVEVNPRYTASVELLELGLGVPMMTLHRAACTGDAIPSAGIPHRLAADFLGKAILFAPHTVTVPDLSAWMQEPIACSSRWPVPRIADVPRAGDVIAEGHPICTVFAAGWSVESCRHALEDAALRLYDQVRVSTHG